jgi:NAD-dependent SIR2 family protein deacetylase
VGPWPKDRSDRIPGDFVERSDAGRYRARSMIGWPHSDTLSPNAPHRALARLEASGQKQMLLTQNVDRLHQAAGSRVVVDRHGHLDLVRCIACSAALRGADFQDAS